LGEEINLLICVVLQLLGDIYNLLFDKILLSVIVDVWLKSVNNVQVRVIRLTNSFSCTPTYKLSKERVAVTNDNGGVQQTFWNSGRN
jgi:hypothetical protein